MAFITVDVDDSFVPLRPILAVLRGEPAGVATEDAWGYSTGLHSEGAILIDSETRPRQVAGVHLT